MHWVYEQVWNLQDDSIGFGLKVGKGKSLRKHEQVFITYGARANSFLLVEYGFTMLENHRDFVRKSDISLASFYSQEELEASQGAMEIF